METLIAPSGGLAIVISGMLALALSPSTRLAIAAALAVPQLFLGLPLPLAQGWVLVIGVSALLDGRDRLPRPNSTLPRIAFALAGLSIVMLLFSADIEQGVSVSLGLIAFAVLLWYAISVGQADRDALDRALMWAAPSMLLQSALTVVFRQRPDVESTFLQSQVGSVFVGSAGQNLYNGLGLNNVLDPIKAGGLIVNGNSASLMMGVAAVAFWVLRIRRDNRVYGMMSLVSLLGVISSGSKTGLALALFLPLAGLAIRHFVSADRQVFLVLMLVSVGVVVMSGAAKEALDRFAPSYSDESASSFGSRELLWSTAWTLFQDHPLMGLGYGGWADSVYSYIGRTDWPPHNMVVAAWANLGILGALLVVVFALTALTNTLRSAALQTESTARHVTTTCWAGVAWVIIHGMGDNTSIFGEYRSMALIAILIGYSSSYSATAALKYEYLEATQARMTKKVG